MRGRVLWAGKEYPVTVGVRRAATAKQQAANEKAAAAECRRRLDAKIAVLESGVLPDPAAASATLKSYLAGSGKVDDRYPPGSWLARKQRDRPLSYVQYEGVVRLHVLGFPVAAVRLAQLGPAHLLAHYDALAAAGRPPATIARTHTILQIALHEAIAQQLPVPPAAVTVKAPSYDPEETLWLGAAQLERLTDRHAADDPWAFLVALMVWSGARVGEALGLQWDDLDETGATLWIRRQIGQRTRKSQILKGKRARPVPLDEAAVAALRDFRARQRQRGAACKPGDLLFADEAGRPFAQNRARDQFAKQLEALGYAGYTPHATRHGHAMVAVRVAPLPDVQRRMGWSSLGVAEKYVGHADRAADHEAAQAIGEALRRRKKVDHDAASPNSGTVQAT